MPAERLQKLIARSGLASRRKAETLITAGRVQVNDQVVDELGSRADPASDRITVDGRPLRFPRTSTYVALWKPSGIVSTAQDEKGRRTVVDLVKGLDARIFPVGRLDMDADGILLLTNDGALSASLTHPSRQVTKLYRCRVRGIPGVNAFQTLTRGITLDDGPAQARVARRAPDSTGNTPGSDWVEISVIEGRKHLVKRMLEAIGHPVIHLRRIRFGPIGLEHLRPGQWRHLRRHEIRRLRSTAGKPT